MIERIELNNFRKFQRFSLRLGAGNILVGPNNAGKSSLLDAFRLFEACFRHSRSCNPILLDVDGKGVFDGYRVPDSILPFSLANVTYNYSDDDAVVEFHNANGSVAVIRLHPERQTVFYIISGGRRLTTSSNFRRAFPGDIVIVPTLAPLEANEPYVEDQTVQRNAATRLASRALRNIWLRKTEEEFDAFRADVEEAWPLISIHRPELRRSYPATVEMFYSEERMDREVQWSGFGFQVWMQILTHLGRGGQGSTVIIDEPDIYLHPDLQRRLLRMLRERYEQFILATHSVEIINDGNAEEIVSISSRYRSGKRITSESDYSALYRYLGSSDNADFARIARARKVIFVEGKDHKIIRRLASRLGFVRLADVQNIPIVQLGGFSQWKKAANAVWAFQQILDLEVQAFCLFDRDYRCDDEIEGFIEHTASEGLNCRVLTFKEIENYLLHLDPLQRAIWRRIRARDVGAVELTINRVVELLGMATDDLKMAVMSQRAAKVLQFEKERHSPLDSSSIIKKSGEQFEVSWKDIQTRLRIVPGKEVLTRLNEIIQKEYSVSVTEAMIIEQMNYQEVEASLLDLLTDLEKFCSD